MNELEIFSLDELYVLSSVENFLRNIQIHLKTLRLDSLRSNLKSNLQIYKFNSIKIYKTRDALRKQSYVATLNFASLVTRRQQVAPTKKSVVGGGGLKGVGGGDFASACSCEHGEAKFKPPPPLQQSKKQPQTVIFYSKNTICNAKFDKTNLAFSRCGSRRVNLKFTRKICFKRRIFVVVIVANML